MQLFKLLKLFRHWGVLIQVGEQIVAKEAAVRTLHPGESATLGRTDASLFGEPLSLALVVTRKSG